MTNTIHNLSCAILAGGKSSRFGSNKALAAWSSSGIRVIEEIINKAGVVTNDIFIIANHEQQYVFTGLPTYPDLYPGLGPLSGIHSALYHAKSDRILILACDMPAISSDFLKWMASIKTWGVVVTPESDSGPEPLHAIWHRSLLPLLDQVVKRGKKCGVRKFMQALPCRSVPPEEYEPLGFSRESLLSANTPAELLMLKDQDPS